MLIKFTIILAGEKRMNLQEFALEITLRIQRELKRQKKKEKKKVGAMVLKIDGGDASRGLPSS